MLEHETQVFDIGCKRQKLLVFYVRIRGKCLRQLIELVNRLQRLLLRPFNRFQIPLQKEILRIEIGLTILGGD